MLAAACLAAGCATAPHPMPPGDMLASAPAAASAAALAAASAATPAAPAAAPAGVAVPPPAGPDASDARQIVRATRRHARRVALAWPVDGSVVAEFQPGRYRGIAISVRAGEPVRAAAAGRVMYAGTGLNDYGSLVIVQHNADFLTAYARGSRLLVKTGDIVRQGEPIAEAGDSGGPRSATVWFEVRRDGKPVDPIDYLPARQG